MTLPFVQTMRGTHDFVFRPAVEWCGPFWEARYNISIEVKNFFGDDFPNLPPDVVAVTLHIRPRTTHLKNEEMTHTEYQTFFTHIPLEPMRQTLFSEPKKELPLWNE